MSVLTTLGAISGIASGVAGAASNVAGSIGSIASQRHLTGAQKEANEFNANQADLQRQFASREAEIARDWDEAMYLKYNSPSAQMRQYNEAGLNPALMYRNGVTPAPQSSQQANGVSAAGVSPNQRWSDVVQNGLALSQLAAQIDNINADTELKRKNANLSEEQKNSVKLQNDVFGTMNELSKEQFEATIANLWQELDNKQVEKNLLKSNVNRNLAETQLAYMNALNSEINSEYLPKLREAEIALSKAQASHSSADIARISKEIEEMNSDIILNGIRNKIYNQEELQAMEKVGLLRKQNEEYRINLEWLPKEKRRAFRSQGLQNTLSVINSVNDSFRTNQLSISTLQKVLGSSIR